MVRKTIIDSILDALEPDILKVIEQELRLIVPPLESQDFVVWSAFCREHLGITQQEMESLTKIGQEDLSKFERNKLHFGPKRREKIREVLVPRLEAAKRQRLAG